MHHDLPTSLSGYGRLKHLCALALAVLALATSFVASPALAVVPATLNYQGFLTNKSTSAPLSATVSVTFKLYDAVTAGTLLYTETQPTVVVMNGVFNAQIGSVTPLSTLAFDKPYFLEITVGTDTLAPRQPLASGATALRASVSDTATTATTVTGTVSGTQITGTITNASLPGTAPWQAPLASTAQQASSNASYIVTAATLTTVTLPASPAVGDVVKVAATAASWGFIVAPNVGQTISGLSSLWTPRDSARAWSSVASSADGSKLVATVSPGQIYLSTDRGVTWSATGAPSAAWTAVASSADGSRLVAVASGVGIYVSGDSGHHVWTLIPGAPTTPKWSSVASSSDGTKLLAADNGGYLYTFSLNTTTSAWTQTTSAPTIGNWTSVASSADGSKLVAVSSDVGIYTGAATTASTTWTRSATQPTPAPAYLAVASSADGSKLLALTDGSAADPIWRWSSTIPIWSQDILTNSLQTPGSPWVNGALVMSQDGGAVVVGATLSVIGSGNTPLVWRSMDGGASFSAGQSFPAQASLTLAASADGNRVVAACTSQPIYLWNGTAQGGANATIELVYAGGGQWNIVNQQNLANAQTQSYGSYSALATNSANGFGSLGANTGSNDTANGAFALYSNTSGFSNTASGSQALYSNTSGFSNTASGSQALYSNTSGNYNTASGNLALYANTAGNYNTASGAFALYTNTTGISNTASGAFALYANTTGNYNTASGVNALYWNTTGSSNTASGFSALNSNRNANGNSAFGSNALQAESFANGGIAYDSNNTAVGVNALAADNPTSTTNGVLNTAVGANAMQSNSTGANNVATGSFALNANTTGIYDTAVGSYAMQLTTIGSNNTVVGAAALQRNVVGNNNTAVGFGALGFLTSGSGNIAIGYNSGSAATGVSSNNNIYIGNVGVVSESGIIRLGAAGTHTATYIAGVLYTPSDRNLKDNFTPVDDLEFLNKVVSLPLLHWSYKNDAQHVLHVGPMAQDFYAAFKVGADERNIATIDEGGVALAAIKGLNQKLERLVKVQAEKIVELEKKSARVAQLEQDRADLAARMAALEQQSAEIAELQRTVKLLLSRDRLNETVALRH